MKKLLWLLCFLLVFMLCACGMNNTQGSGDDTQPAQGARFVGRAEGNTYINDVIGFSATIPEGWRAATFDQMSRLFDVSVNDLNNTKSLEPESQMFIFFCTKYPYGSTESNPGLGVQVSNQSSMTPLLTSEQALSDYMEKSRPGLEQQFGGEAALSCETGVQVGGNEYSVIHISADYNDMQLLQDVYILGINDYVLMITETYSDESDKMEADTFLESLEITQKS